jgi:hypothetical protein
MPRNISTAELEDVLKTAKRELVEQEWECLNNTWASLPQTHFHRTRLKSVKNIEDVKTIVFNALGIMPTFIFLNEIFHKYDYIGPYRAIEKGLLILYQLITGATIPAMEKFIPSSMFQKISHEFWITHMDELDTYLDMKLKSMFSLPIIRTVSAHLNNLDDFKGITMYLDGYDNQVDYSLLRQ